MNKHFWEEKKKQNHCVPMKKYAFIFYELRHLGDIIFFFILTAAACD